MLISSEEVEFQKTFRDLSSHIVQYVKNQERIGGLNSEEKKFLMEGVVFKPLKLNEGIRQDILQIKEL